MFRGGALACVLVLGAGMARAAGDPLPTVVLPPNDDKLAIKLAEQLEFALEADERVIIESRDGLTGALDKQDPFGRGPLKRAMGEANVSVLVRVARSGTGRSARWQVIVYDKEGLDLQQADVSALKSPADSKKEAKRIGGLLGKWLGDWDGLRDRRREKAEADEAEARRPGRKTTREDEPPPDGETEEEGGGRGGRVLVGGGGGGEDDWDIPPPPDEDAPPPRKPAKKTAPPPDDDGFSVVEKDDAPKKGKKGGRDEPAKPASRKKGNLDDEPVDEGGPIEQAERTARADPDEPDDGITESPAPRKKKAAKPAKKKEAPRRKGLLDDSAEGGGKKRSPIEEFVLGLYSLKHPTPYFSVSMGPSVVAWSYALWSPVGTGGQIRRRTTHCSPTILNVYSFGCTPHGGADALIEAWPIRYLGMEAAARGAFTVYQGARSASTGDYLTDQRWISSTLGSGHLALKARFVNTFGPAFLHGLAAGVRVRAAYARNVVGKQTPFVAVPGYHAYQIGGGVETYIPLLWKHLSFDARAEITPLVRYQEVVGIPTQPQEVFLPTRLTLSNPGRSTRALGWRAEGGVRGTALAGFFAEVRLFTEGFVALYTGTGSRLDAAGNPIHDGRVLNQTFGLTLGVGWLFPQGLAPLYGTW